MAVARPAELFDADEIHSDSLRELLVTDPDMARELGALAGRVAAFGDDYPEGVPRKFGSELDAALVASSAAAHTAQQLTTVALQGWDNAEIGPREVHDLLVRLQQEDGAS